eukprot:comp24156_c1_seq1/m.44004 comp24156_c1_seq1/g.44004  ORF comp24156_c1_seq1/g.44004 comp24156_c1_seq1/m.44004 type:complete len:338 (-) comp24156_c1_seq1:492-1505(-)
MPSFARTIKAFSLLPTVFKHYFSAMAGGKARGVKQVITAQKFLEGGGFPVRRPVGAKVSQIDPFLMLDHLGPIDYAPGEAIGAPDHPHRGFETVTYVLEGSMHHQDSAGNEGKLSAGWVQWMTAGSGVVHSEMPSDDMLKNGGRLEGFQLWVNLPKKDKMIPPRYQDTPAEKIPVAVSEDGNVSVKVIAGESMGKTAVIDTRTPIIMLDITLKNGSTHTQNVPENYDGFAYVYRGAGTFGTEKTKAKEGQAVVLAEGDEFSASADGDEVRYLLICGVPIREPIAKYGPFVMNTQEEIYQAFEDYRAGKLGKIEGSEERYAKTDAARKKQRESGRTDL